MREEIDVCLDDKLDWNSLFDVENAKWCSNAMNLQGSCMPRVEDWYCYCLNSSHDADDEDSNEKILDGSMTKKTRRTIEVEIANENRS